jgi:hypothetical protein
MTRASAVDAVAEKRNGHPLAKVTDSMSASAHTRSVLVL